MYSKKHLYDAGRKGCLRMLSQGFVGAFEESLGLMEKDQGDTGNLKKDPKSVKILREGLRKSEEASRAGNMQETYNSRMELAEYFGETKGYDWLAEYLLKSCHSIAESEDGDNAQLQTKALKLLGILEEGRDNMEEAVKYLQSALDSCGDNEESKKELYQNLITMHQKLGDQYLYKEVDHVRVKNSKAVRNYEKSIKLSEDYGTIENQATSYGLLGRAMMKFNKNKLALEIFEKYLSLSKECDDLYAICNANFALSEMHKRLGDIEKSTEFLLECHRLAKENQLVVPLIFSSIHFGQLDTARRKYFDAHEHFETAYKTLLRRENSLMDADKLCRVMCGVGRAHLTLGKLANELNKPEELSLLNIIRWRNTGRMEDFEFPNYDKEVEKNDD